MHTLLAILSVVGLCFGVASMAQIFIPFLKKCFFIYKKYLGAACPFSNFTFTPCGAVNVAGPTQAQCQAAYQDSLCQLGPQTGTPFFFMFYFL